jgi:hypothetical protein
MSTMKTLAASALALAALSALATPATAAPKASTSSRAKVSTALVVLMPGNRTAIVHKTTPRDDRCGQAALATALGVEKGDLTVEAKLNDSPARCIVHLTKAVDIRSAIVLQNGQPVN